MNNAGRKKLKQIFDDFGDFYVGGDPIEAAGKDEEVRKNLSAKLSDMSSEVQSILDEEQEKFDNMPEGLQGGSKGDELQEKIDSLQTAVDKLEEAQSTVENDWTAESDFDIENWAEDVKNAIDEADEAATSV